MIEEKIVLISEGKLKRIQAVINHSLYAYKICEKPLNTVEEIIAFIKGGKGLLYPVRINKNYLNVNNDNFDEKISQINPFLSKREWKYEYEQIIKALVSNL
jgi:hypothetical protein